MAKLLCGNGTTTGPFGCEYLRYFYMVFLSWGICLSGLSLTSQGQKPQLEPAVRLDENAEDPSAENLACYKIETPTATYFLEKKGLGLSSLLDREGVDWINFHPKKKSGAKGEYRGFPNAVFKEGGSFFHPLNAGTEPSTSSVEKNNPGHVSILAVSGNKAWECRWDFYVTHCTFTMTKMPAGRKYWILYEGTPGGECDKDDWWMTSAISEKMPLATEHKGDIPAPEWIAFGDPGLGRSLFVWHKEDDDHLDQFYLMKNSMTVMGFGRQKLNKYFDKVPQSFAIGILESTDHQEITAKISGLSEGNDK